MKYHIDIQNVGKMKIPINKETLINWATMTLSYQVSEAELTIRLVDIEEITLLNSTYRGKNKPTNVLAFPSNLPTIVDLEFQLLGDVIICPEIVINESKSLNKTLESHFAHLVVHGILHLLGFDHENDEDAQKMQEIEIKILNKLGYSNPYLEDDNEI